MILEGIVTTLNDDATLNIAPMGPRVDPGTNLARFELRPYRSSTTYHNLKARGEGVFHVTDDVLLLAQTAIGVAVSPAPKRDRRTWWLGEFWSTPAGIMSFASRNWTTATNGRRSWPKPPRREGCATSSASTGPGTRCSRLRSWRLAPSFSA